MLQGGDLQPENRTRLSPGSHREPRSEVVRSGDRLLVRKELSRERHAAADEALAAFKATVELQQRLARQPDSLWASIESIVCDDDSVVVLRAHFSHNLQEFIAAHSVTPAEIWGIARGVADGIEAVAADGSTRLGRLAIDNVLIDESRPDTPVLTDPSVATTTGREPEQSLLADFGELLYLLLVGVRCPRGSRWNIKFAKDKRLRRIFAREPDVAEKWHTLCTDLLRAHSPESKITLESAIAQLDALRPKGASRRKVVAPSPAKKPRPRRSPPEWMNIKLIAGMPGRVVRGITVRLPSRRRVGVVIAMVVGLGLAGGAVVWLGGGDGDASGSQDDQRSRFAGVPVSPNGGAPDGDRSRVGPGRGRDPSSGSNEVDDQSETGTADERDDPDSGSAQDRDDHGDGLGSEQPGDDPTDAVHEPDHPLETGEEPRAAPISIPTVPMASLDEPYPASWHLLHSKHPEQTREIQRRLEMIEEYWSTRRTFIDSEPSDADAWRAMIDAAHEAPRTIVGLNNWDEAWKRFTTNLDAWRDAVVAIMHGPRPNLNDADSPFSWDQDLYVWALDENQTRFASRVDAMANARRALGLDDAIDVLLADAGFDSSEQRAGRLVLRLVREAETPPGTVTHASDPSSTDEFVRERAWLQFDRALGMNAEESRTDPALLAEGDFLDRVRARFPRIADQSRSPRTIMKQRIDEILSQFVDISFENSLIEQNRRRSALEFLKEYGLSMTAEPPEYLQNLLVSLARDHDRSAIAWVEDVGNGEIVRSLAARILVAYVGDALESSDDVERGRIDDAYAIVEGREWLRDEQFRPITVAHMLSLLDADADRTTVDAAIREVFGPSADLLELVPRERPIRPVGGATPVIPTGLVADVDSLAEQPNGDWLVRITVNTVPLWFRSIGTASDGKLAFLASVETPISAMPQTYREYIRDRFDFDLTPTPAARREWERPAVRMRRSDLDSLIGQPNRFRLPTQAEWNAARNSEGASRETRGDRIQRDPRGDRDLGVGRFYGPSDRAVRNGEGISVLPSPIDRSAERFQDLIGNVWEIVESGGNRLIVGGSIQSEGESVAWNDTWDAGTPSDVGFRLAFDADMPQPTTQLSPETPEDRWLELREELLRIRREGQR